jgi:hypothetical protein
MLLQKPDFFAIGGNLVFAIIPLKTQTPLGLPLAVRGLLGECNHHYTWRDK